MKKGKILKLKMGYNPNSSSHGAVIIFLLSIVGGIVDLIMSIIISKKLSKELPPPIEEE